MTTQTSDGDGGKDEGRPPVTRLEREVAEILERSERQPISFSNEVRRRGDATRAAAHQSAARPESLVARFERLGSGRYLVVAVAAAILALVVSDFSPLLANLLAIVCVAAIFIPVVQRFRQPETPMSQSWRGRDLGGGLSRPAGMERIFDRFRRPPRI